MDSDDDDLYGQDEPVAVDKGPSINGVAEQQQVDEVKQEDLEEGEEEEEGVDDDSEDDDINFITDARDVPKADIPDIRRPPSVALPSQIAHKTSPTPVSFLKTEQSIDRKSTPVREEKPGSDYPARHTSTIDPNADPTHPSTGKPIQATDFDADFPGESSKPWRKPGSDITDYFNYGFDEFTWASYCLKQQEMPKEISEIKAQADFMKSFVEGIPGGGIPGMPPVPTAPAAQGSSNAMPPMPGMPGEAEMQQRIMAMMERGIDPSSMDPEQFMQHMMRGGGGAGSGPGFPGQAPAFGGMQAGGQHQQTQMGYPGGGGGNFEQGANYGRGRGRGRRGW